MKKTAILLVLGLFLTVSCAEREPKSLVSNVDFTPCQQDMLRSNALSDGVIVKFVNGGVQIMYPNFEVHCDFTTVNVSHTFVNGFLNITQQGDGDARCICYTDVSYTINGISQREVNVIFINGVQVYCYNDNGSSNLDLRIGEITEIKLGETANNSQYGLSLRVDTIIDSRCPIGVVCVWPGRADVQLQLTTKNGKYDFTLNKMGMQGGRSCEGVVIEGMRYYLVDVLPYPNIEERNPIKTVKILVTKENTDCDQNVIISAIEFNNAPNHPVSIIDMKIEGNCLKIKFGASGCSGDNWTVKLIAVPSIAAVYPPQWGLRLSLNDIGDCAAYFTKEMSFNIENLQRPGTSGAATLIIAGQRILYEY
jgi:hypothetical protein